MKTWPLHTREVISLGRATVVSLIAALSIYPMGIALAQCPEEPPLQNYTGSGAVVCPCFIPGEEAGVILDVPPEMYPIEILRVGIGWGSLYGSTPQSLEDAIHIYEGGLPNPGSPVFSLFGPLLTDGAINVFDLEPSPGEVIINSGPFTVTLQFLNSNAGDPYAPSAVHDGNGCQPGKNVVYAVPGGWFDACALGVTGDWVFFVVYRPVRPAMLAPAPEFVVFSDAPINETSCDTVLLVNDGCETLQIQSISGCSGAPFSIDTTATARSVPPSGSTTMTVCVTPTGSDPDSCTVTIVSNDTTGPTFIPVSLASVTAVTPLAIPGVFEIVSAVPNPFNPSTAVRFRLPEAMPVTVDIWSVDGRRIRTLASEELFPSGENELVWNGQGPNGNVVASGVYFIRVSTPLGEEVTQAVLLK